MRRAFSKAALVVAALAMAGASARAEDATEIEARRAESSGAYARLTDELVLSDSRQKQLADEVAKIRKDNVSITAALIQAAKTEKKLADDVADIEARLADLRVEEVAIKASLTQRRGVLAEVLGALQRMGLNPPPAILVSPEDALSSVRSAILLGAVIPELRNETTVLIADLAEMSRITQTIDAERLRLVTTMQDQVAGKERLSLLLDEKKKLQAQSEQNLQSERSRAADLAAKAGSLKDLIESLDADLAAARKAAEEARIAEETRRAREEQSAQLPVPEPNRLTAAAPFSALQGMLALPVSGQVVRRFGHIDDAGMTSSGDTVRTQSGAIVTAPSDGTVLYAGPFRSFGQLLILDAGSGYHVVMTGLGRISVSLGQAVIAGEPVGAMGETRVASALAVGSENSQPELYIEFRKDQEPVDPAPWWLERQPGRTEHDS